MVIQWVIDYGYVWIRKGKFGFECECDYDCSDGGKVCLSFYYSKFFFGIYDFNDEMIMLVILLLVVLNLLCLIKCKQI